jgi:hypothetical protein
MSGFEIGQVIQVKYFGRDPVTGAMRLSRKVLLTADQKPVHFMREETVQNSYKKLEKDKYGDSINSVNLIKLAESDKNESNVKEVAKIEKALASVLKASSDVNGLIMGNKSTIYAPILSSGSVKFCLFCGIEGRAQSQFPDIKAMCKNYEVPFFEISDPVKFCELVNLSKFKKEKNQKPHGIFCFVVNWGTIEEDHTILMNHLKKTKITVLL